MSQSDKSEAIIQAALKRFSHFGVGKTTMNEIADDLSISKASLYCYFRDKLNLYAVVLQKIMATEDVNSQEYREEMDTFKAISIYLDNRTRFIIKYYNILEYLKTLASNIPKELESVFSAARTRELKVIKTILENGKSAKLLNVEDPKKTAELFLDCLEGLRYSLISQKANFFPDKKQFQVLLKRENDFAAIFLKGLRC